MGKALDQMTPVELERAALRNEMFVLLADPADRYGQVRDAQQAAAALRAMAGIRRDFPDADWLAIVRMTRDAVTRMRRSEPVIIE